ncbi:MAG TPA: winged helix-turn-helix domain-containing protein [Acetobacteraceae bacterium]|nr:winged helix-turn-helix domain-containing protein [Acetobacteraceae bacterium]
MPTLDKPVPDAFERLRFAAFVIDTAGHTLTGPGGREVPLRRGEFNLLLAFLRAPGRVLSRDHLLDAVAGRQSAPFDRSIDMLISRLRRKIEADPEAPRLILTVPGLGYKFAAKPQPVQAASADRFDSRPSGPAMPPDKASLAVLPFQNMSGDPRQDYFADGMTEEIITALSRIPSFGVVSRHSTFAYKGNSPDIRQVGRELEVRYVLEGSVRKTSQRMRITGQLIEAANGVHLWADRFDVPVADIFEVQDQITASVIGAIEPKLQQAEIERARRKPADNLQAYDLVLRSRFTFSQATRDALEESCRLLERAIELDPNSPLALAWLARTQYSMDAQNFRFPTAAEVDRYVRMAQRAVGLVRDDPEVLVVASIVIGQPGGELTEATALVDRALALNPNSAEAWAMSGMLQAYVGNADTALAHLDRSVQLCPMNLWVNWHHTAFARAHFAAGHYEEVLVWLERGLRRFPDHVVVLKEKAAALGLLGRVDEARQVVQHLRALVPDLTISRLRDVGAILYKHAAETSALGNALLEGLRRAGLPE